MNQSTINHSQTIAHNKSISTNSANQYETKLQNAYLMNVKLKELYQTIKHNNLIRKREMSQNSQSSTEFLRLDKLKKQQVKLQNEIQQSINNLNVLISQNAKLKAQVDNSRNSRVIYSNIYKNIEKQIKKHEYLYRYAIIEFLEYEEVQNKLSQKINKTVKKLQKEVLDLEGGISKIVRKKDKNVRKSRLDTGIQSSQREQSMPTSRGVQDDFKLNSRRNDKIQQSNLVKTQKLSLLAIKPESVQKQSLQRMKIMTKLKTKVIQMAPQNKQKKPLIDVYQAQMISTYYENIIKHLKQITQLQDINQISNIWLQIDNQIQFQYRTYLEYEQKLKQLDEKDEHLSKQIQVQNANSLGIKSVEEQQLQAILEEIERQKILIEQNQNKLTQMIDINTHKLSDEDIHHHILRIKRKGETNNRQLQKLLQNVRKQKSSLPKNLKSSKISQT